MKKSIYIFLIVLLNTHATYALSLCEAEAYAKCLQLYDSSIQQRQAAKKLNMTKEEYCHWLAEEYCTPLYE